MRFSLTEKKQLVKGVWEFSFGLESKKFHFKAGQYVRVVVPNLIKKDTKGPGRVFSIASSPNDKKKITIIFRVSKSGYKQTLAQTKLGDKLEIEGPWGTLNFPRETKSPIVFIAGGTGIAPFLSIIRFASEKNFKHNIFLVYSSRTVKSAFYLDELNKLAKANSNFKMKAVYGPIGENSFPKEIFSAKKTRIFISGPSPMIDKTISLLRQKGVALNDICFEEWSEYTFQKVRNQLMEATLDALIFTDLNGFFRYVNPAWQKLTGWKSKEVINKVTPRIVKSGAQSQAFYKKLWGTALAGKVYKFEAVNKKKNGKLYRVEEISVPLKAPSGSVYGHFVIQRDITKLSELTAKLAEKIKERTESLNNVIQSMGEGLAMVDKDMKTIIVNRAAQDMLGWSEKEIFGRIWPEMVGVGTEKINVLPVGQSPLAKAIGGQTTISTVGGPVTYYYLKKDKTRFPVSIVATPLLSKGKIIGSIVVFRDITKEKEIDKSKSEFLALASHQLRTPLTGIKWVAELLASKEKFTERGRQYINEINASAGRLSTLIDSLLNVSRIEMGRVIVKVEPIDAVSFIMDYVKHSEPVAAKKNIKLIFEKHPQELKIVTDPVILYNILHTFISNAIDYTPRDGKIELSLDKKEKTFVISIKDNGIGIPKEEQKDIFKKFMRGTKAKLMQPDGNGLGLYLASQMAKLLGDEIWFESEEGKGTAFHIELPLESKSVSGEVRFEKTDHAR